MSGDFIDTNVFIYAFTHDRRRAGAMRVIGDALDSRSAHVSFQVVQECLRVLTERLSPPPRQEDITDFVRSTLVPMWTVMPSFALYESSLRLQTRYRIPFYDSLIVAAALEAGCDRLVSEDFQHGQRIEGLTFHNPFL